MFSFAHTCLTVRELDRTLAFYREALGLHPTRRLRPCDQDIELVFLSDGAGKYEMEVGCPADKSGLCLPDENHHMAFSVADIEKAHALHEFMGVIFRDSPEGVYFIKDPDGYLIEIIPENPDPPVPWEYIEEKQEENKK